MWNLLIGSYLDVDVELRHECPILRSIERHIHKWQHRTAPMEGITLLSKEMMQQTELYNPDQDAEIYLEQLLRDLGCRHE